jgi:DegV family protein with EDD domain
LKIGLVTDSTCDLTQEFMEKNNIEIVPLSVYFGEDIFIDRKDINSEDFFRILKERDELPRTSQPSIGLFLTKYEEMSKDYDVILSIHISGKLSGTIKSAQIAAKELLDINIRIIDSRSTSLGLGFLVQLASELIAEGKTIDDIINILEMAIEKTRLYFIVDELTYLEKGGRIGKAQAFLGSVLNFKPVLELDSKTGEILPKKKIRGNTKAMNFIIKTINDLLEEENNAWFGLIYGERDNNILKFKNMFLDYLNGEKIKYRIETNQLSPILGTHVGPSVFGVVIISGDFLQI